MQPSTVRPAARRATATAASATKRDLLGDDRADVIAILYGINDARYTAAPATFNHDDFVRDYRDVLAGLVRRRLRARCHRHRQPAASARRRLRRGHRDGFAGQTRAEFQRYVGTVEIDRARSRHLLRARQRADGRRGRRRPHPRPTTSTPTHAGHAKIAEIFADATHRLTRFLR